jgi:hypothetical protein
MAGPEGGAVSRHAFQVAYHGVHADDHSMDVEALAPALLAFGKLIREANAEINEDRATVKVLVTSDFEHRCFNISFEVVQTLIQKIKSLLDDDHIEKAKDLLQTIGVIATAASTVGATLLGFLKWKNGKKIKKAQRLRDADSSGVVIVEVEGEGNTIQVTNNVFKLAENPKILDAVEKTLTPIEAHEAEKIEFREGSTPTATYDRQDIKAIIASCEIGPDPIAIDTKPTPEIVTATLHVYSPVFDEKAKNWRFTYKRKHIYADISQTSIAKDVLKRGGSFVNDRYRVRMEIIPLESPGGEPTYKILEVLDFTPAPQQTTLTLRTPRRKKKAGK